MKPPETLKTLSVQRAADLQPASDQTQNAVRISGVSVENSQVENLWFGKVHTGPGEISDPHPHGVTETGGYIFKGNGYICFGECYENIVYMSEGDFVYVPPFVPHIEGNLSKSEELIWITTRTPNNIVVNFTDQDVADIEIEWVD